MVCRVRLGCRALAGGAGLESARDIGGGEIIGSRCPHHINRSKHYEEGSIPLDESACGRLLLAAVREPAQVDAERTRLLGGAPSDQHVGTAQLRHIGSP